MGKPVMGHVTPLRGHADLDWRALALSAAERDRERRLRLAAHSDRRGEHPEAHTVWCPDCGEGALCVPGRWTRCERCNTEHLVDA